LEKVYVPSTVARGGAIVIETFSPVNSALPEAGAAVNATAVVAATSAFVIVLIFYPPRYITRACIF
jgi:hypothetical protein